MGIPNFSATARAITADAEDRKVLMSDPGKFMVCWRM